MNTCEQTHGMTILQHGISVGDRFLDLYNHIFNYTPLKFTWDLPDNFIKHYRNCGQQQIMTISNALLYSRYHDCGKPLCMMLDEDGKKHFPDHAKISYNLWMEYTNNEYIGWFILHDMDLHTKNFSDISAISQDVRIYSLLMMSYAEVHSNAAMFGGILSTSFKIKRKHLDKICKKLLVTN
jgi:hypothetical protein